MNSRLKIMDIKLGNQNENESEIENLERIINQNFLENFL
jgi:hypothetical protein